MNQECWPANGKASRPADVVRPDANRFGRASAGGERDVPAKAGDWDREQGRWANTAMCLVQFPPRSVLYRLKYGSFAYVFLVEQSGSVVDHVHSTPSLDFLRWLRREMTGNRLF